MRRYDDPVEVRKGLCGGVEGPEQFLWRGRLWKVRAVLAHWVETGPWWQSAHARAVIGSEDAGDTSQEAAPDQPRPIADLLSERELWRVEAARGAAYVDSPGDGRGGEPDGGGVFDLCFDWADGQWQLVGCVD
jgi:hypothetical protein